MSELNHQQQVAISDPSPRLLVVAGAGSGKSRVLVKRILRTINEGVPPSAIIAISFTNTASSVLQQRLGGIKLGVNSTLHSFLLRLLLRHGGDHGLPVAGVIDEDAKEATVEQAIAALRYRGPVKDVLPLLRDPRLIWPERGFIPTKSELVAIEYHRILRMDGLLDYDSLLATGVRFVERALAKRPEWWPYTHLFADEIQDSAREDWAIYEGMPVDNRFIVGDDSQAVYSFRGSDVSEFVSRATKPDTTWTVLPLEFNYRSGHAICEAANRLISHNQNRIDKKLIATRPGGTVEAKGFDTPAGEACFILDELARLNQPEPGSPVAAVLTRTNALANDLSEFLTARGINVVRPSKPQMPRDWRQTLALLAALAQPYNDRAVLRYIALAEGKDAAVTAQKAAARAMQSVSASLGKKFHVEYADLFPSLALFGVSDASRELVSRVIVPEMGLPEVYAAAQAIGQDERDAGNGIVFVGTIHAAKGREWPMVFVAGCEEGSLPLPESRADLPEERRLAYVAVTRAMDRLVLTWSRQRPQNRGPNMPLGPMEPKEPSRFIGELAP